MHDNTNAPGVAGTTHVARFEKSNGNAVFAALGVGSYVNTVRYDGNQNYVQVSSQDTSSILVNMVAGSGKNATEIAHPGARTTILNAIGDASGYGLRNANANPTWCHATGERIGSVSGKFYDKLGYSGASPNTNHHWVKESDQYAIQSYMTPGNTGDSVGMSYAIPGNSNFAAFTYQKAAAPDQEYWGLRIANAGAMRFYQSAARPESDNTVDLGTSSARMKTIYAVTGTINTSDAREKEQFSAIPDAWLDAWADVQLVRYKWIDRVLEKGAGARFHVGVVSQDFRDALISHGVDPSEVAAWCYDQWGAEYEDVLEVAEETQPDGSVATVARPTGERLEVLAAGERFGLRPEQCLFLNAALERRERAKMQSLLDDLSNRLAVLEARP
jgi:hypothetical protein